MNAELMTGYEAQVREHRLAFSRGCAWAAIVLILLGMGLDYGLYRERQVLFGEARIVFSLLILGVIGLITPWNFPMSIPAWKLGPALVTGNTVVWKPCLQSPQTSQMLAELLIEAGLPAGVLNLVHGDGPDVGQAIVEHHAGRLRAQSDGPGAGSVFTVELPALAAEEAHHA